MGRVYRARDLRLQRPAALKVIAAHSLGSPQVLERFRREAVAAAAVSHPNVVPVFEAGESDGVPFIAMALVDGTDLATLLAEEGRLPYERAMDILGDVAAALDAAHKAGVVHRDVKPSNVLIADTDAGATVYLTDFGIARRLGDKTITKTGRVL